MSNQNIFEEFSDMDIGSESLVDIFNGKKYQVRCSFYVFMCKNPDFKEA